MSPSTTSAPSYSQRRIGTLRALHVALGMTVNDLLTLAERANNLYRVAKSITKPDGSIRNTYDAREPLKEVHRRIKSQILDHVNYPAYLTGSIKGCDYKINASLHARARIVINEDISGFFPATSADRVFSIWRGFFGFSEEGGCAEFCVNGQSTAGASRPVRKHNEHQETRRTRRTAVWPAG